jgi:hypothetical protein
MQRAEGVLAVLFFFGIIAFGIAQIVVGYLGIDYHLGPLWALAAVVVVFLFRFALPLTIGSFFGAMDVLGWHWVIALAFAAPGLLFIIPGVLSAIVGLVRAQRA